MYDKIIIGMKLSLVCGAPKAGSVGKPGTTI